MAKKQPNWMESAELWQQRIRQIVRYFEENKRIVPIIIGVAILLLGGVGGYRWYQQTQNSEAQREMFNAVYYFEEDSVDLSVYGDGNSLGFEEIVAGYGNTSAGNLARFYAGAASLKAGRYDSAIQHLTDFDAQDLLVQARAYALLGDAYAEKAQYDQAANWYIEAATYQSNPYFSPVYWQKAAIALESDLDYTRAAWCYEQIVQQHYESSLRQDAEKYHARLLGLAARPPASPDTLSTLSDSTDAPATIPTAPSTTP